MITTSRPLASLPRSHLFADIADYHRARPGHSDQTLAVVNGIQEQDSDQVPGDLLAEWDILFHTLLGPVAEVRGDVVAHRTLRRDRHSRTDIAERDSHPVVLLAQDVRLDSADAVWARVLGDAVRGGTFSDVLYEYDHKEN